MVERMSANHLGPESSKVGEVIVYVSTSITAGINESLPLAIDKVVEAYQGKVNNKHVIWAGHDESKREEFLREYTQKYLGKDLPPKGRPEFKKIIYKLDMLLVDKATHLILILDKPSFGVALELQQALTRPARGLSPAKILGLIHKDNYPKLSFIVQGAAEVYPNFEIAVYEDIADAQNIVKEFIKR